jgi:hypothetical protein
MLNNESITFGKYSGKELNVILKDRKYCYWLINQEWFQTNYEYLYNRIKEYKPSPYFLDINNTDSTDFLDIYPYFFLKNLKDIELPLTDSEQTCYTFYSDTIQDLKQRIISRESEDNKYAIKAPVKWLQTFENNSGLKREDFKAFLYSYELPNITSIVEDIKKQGGIEYKGAKSFLIAKQNSEKQEKWWESILKAEFGENLGTQFKYKNCIFDFINISTNTIYECKLALKDFNEEQYNKYLIALEEYRIIYLIGNDCVINCVDKTIETIDENKYKIYLSTVKNPNKFEISISEFEIKNVKEFIHLHHP